MQDAIPLVRRMLLVMSPTMSQKTTIIMLLLALAACTPVVPTRDAANMFNPASKYCQDQGFILILRTAEDGSQSGACAFPDGSECDEWAYFRGECGPNNMKPISTTTPAPSRVDGWKVYRDTEFGYRFEYPEGVEFTTGNDPTGSLILSGSNLVDGEWSISHPAGREEFRPPEGSNLEEWLTRHHLLGEKRMPDETIAGTTAVHFRHERSPQSYADDRYYFIHGTQLFLVIIGHGEQENWVQSSRFLKSIQFE